MAYFQSFSGQKLFLNILTLDTTRYRHEAGKLGICHITECGLKKKNVDFLIDFFHLLLVKCYNIQILQ